MEKALDISVSDIFNLLGDSQRPLIEGEAISRSKNLFFCGIQSKQNNCLLIKSSCLQTSKITEKPHEIQIKVFLVNDNKKIECYCSCKAGAGSKCKHVFATLLFVNR